VGEIPQNPLRNESGKRDDVPEGFEQEKEYSGIPNLPGKGGRESKGGDGLVFWEKK